MLTFQPHSARISAQSKKLLGELAQEIAELKGRLKRLRIVVDGHKTRLALAQKRGKAVRTFLIQNKVNPRLLKTTTRLGSNLGGEGVWFDPDC